MVYSSKDSDKNETEKTIVGIVLVGGWDESVRSVIYPEKIGRGIAPWMDIKILYRM